MDLTAGLMCEQRIAEIHQRQIEHGVCFDIRKAQWTIHSLNEKLLNLYLGIKDYLSYDVLSPNAYKSTKPFTKAGAYTKHTLDWYTSDVSIVGGEFCKVIFESPDHILTKREKLGKQLIKLGWEPKEYTATKLPILVKGGEPCPNLKHFGILGRNLSMYYILIHRRNQIIGFTKHIWYDDKGICRISSHANTIGTPTFRYTHRVVANIPSGGSVFGKEMRSLFTVPKGYKAIGTDASGLELRVLASFMNDPEYTKAVVEGNSADGTDIHSVNQRLAGLATRGQAKAMIYCHNYGGGNKKLGEIVGGGAKEGKKLRDSLMRGLPKLKKLIDAVQKEASGGTLTGLDGRRIIMRRDPRGEVMTHKALNTLIQSTGAIVMKYAGILLYEWIQELGLDAVKIIDYHDEQLLEVAEQDVEMVERLCHYWVREAGNLLGMQCPLDSDVKVGKTWYDVH